MIHSSQKIIRLVLQDLGPVCLPGTKIALPGLVWPKAILGALGKAIYERGVDIELVLSNPNSIPGGLKGTEANYGNGWSAIDVAAEIIKAIQKQHSDVNDGKLRAMIKDNLRICFVRHGKSSKYQDGKTIGLHSKHFIVDDICCYIGSQNLYMCDLAEWGIVVDSKEEVKTIMNDYFIPMWTNSYTGEDVDVEQVMDGLKVNRNGEYSYFSSLHNTNLGQQMPHGGRYYDNAPDTEVVEIELSDAVKDDSSKMVSLPATSSSDDDNNDDQYSITEVNADESSVKEYNSIGKEKEAYSNETECEGTETKKSLGLDCYGVDSALAEFKAIITNFGSMLPTLHGKKQHPTM